MKSDTVPPDPMDPDAFLPYLAAELQRTRINAGVSQREMARIVGRNNAGLKKFEDGAAWQGLDRLVHEYVEVTSVPAFELWTRALARWARALGESDAVALLARFAEELPEQEGA